MTEKTLLIIHSRLLLHLHQVTWKQKPLINEQATHDRFQWTAFPLAPTLAVELDGSPVLATVSKIRFMMKSEPVLVTKAFDVFAHGIIACVKDRCLLMLAFEFSTKQGPLWSAYDSFRLQCRQNVLIEFILTDSGKQFVRTIALQAGKVQMKFNQTLTIEISTFLRAEISQLFVFKVCEEFQEPREILHIRIRPNDIDFFWFALLNCCMVVIHTGTIPTHTLIGSKSMHQRVQGTCIRSDS